MGIETTRDEERGDLLVHFRRCLDNYMIIVISSRSGGVGKSTTAQHLAAYLAQRRGAGMLPIKIGSCKHQGTTYLQEINRRIAMVQQWMDELLRLPQNSEVTE